MELRKDYILDRWVFLASERKIRPREFKTDAKEQKAQICYFCPGNEHLTPPESGRIGKEKWKIRWFPNKFPAMALEGNPIVKTDNKYFTFSDSYGKHEVIAETRDHDKQLWDLPEEDIREILEVYNNRIQELSRIPNVKYVLVFKNHGEEAGTSLIHSHTQVAAVNIMPVLIQEEVAASKRYNSCPYCEIISVEKQSYRRCFENDSFVAFTPYASRFNYEIWIFPKRHLRALNELTKEELDDCADILTKVVRKLKELNVSYNYYLHYSPENEDLHFHIEVAPRIATWAGFELGSEAVINSVSPEDAARFYRGEK